jgi:hypothetical protein
MILVTSEIFLVGYTMVEESNYVEGDGCHDIDGKMMALS